MIQQDAIDRVVRQFQSLGVSPQEGRAYIALLTEEGVSGYRISQNAGIPSSKIYTVLNKLIENGFAVATDTRPVKYFPRPPEELLERMEKDVTSTFASLGTTLKSIRNGGKANGVPAWNITGRLDVIHKAKEIIEGAAGNIFLATWAKELRPLRTSLIKAVDRGVALRVLAYGPTTFEHGKIYHHRPSDYPYREHGERRFVLTSDNEKAVIANIGEQGAQSGLWTENHGLVLLFRDFVIHEIYIAQVEEAYPEQIRKLAGRDWRRLRLS